MCPVSHVEMFDVFVGGEAADDDLARCFADVVRRSDE
jgi:hypothetical protein